MLASNLRRLLGVALLSLVGCGPYLEERPLAPHTFSTPEGCGQGPFRLSVDAVGAPWGEEVVILQRGGRPFTGRFEVLIDGEKISWGPVVPPPPVYTPGQPAPPPKPLPATNRCVLSEDERAETARTTAPGELGEPSEPGGATPPVDEPVPPHAPPPRLIEITSDGEWGTELLRFGVQVDAWEKIQMKWKEGAHIEIVLWSDVAIDMTGVTLIVGHHVWSPSSGEAEWRAHLDEKKVESDRRAAAYAVEVAAHTAEWQATTDRCAALAQSDRVDESCRNLGWANASEPPKRPVVSEPAPPQPREPDGPPPPPRVEVPSPKPSEHAEWVAGSWSWDGFAWLWLDGGYRVPDQDRESGATATAPSLPPPPQREEPPHPPTAGIVWIGGHWQWSGPTAGRWVWVGGRYARPPSRSARWRADVWVRDGARVRLDPGMWVVGH